MTSRFVSVSESACLIDMPETLEAVAAGIAPAKAVRLWGDERVYATHTMD